MSLYDITLPSLHYFSNVDQFCTDDSIDDGYSFSPPFPSTENSSDIQSSIDYLETIFSDESMEFPVHVDELYANSIDDFQMYLDEIDHIFNDGAADHIPQPLVETEERNENHHFHQSYDDGFHHDHVMGVGVGDASMDMTSMHPSSLVVPFVGMEVDNLLCLVHLRKAYGEAMESKEIALSEVIAQRVVQKVNPVGRAIERLLYYMFQRQNRESDYLTQESIKNFYPAFKAFYQIFPYGKFAHFVANLAILEALPSDVEIIHLIDFDFGGGIQWASLMEAIKHQCKEIRLTSIRFVEDDDEASPFRWRFEETKRRLCDHAMSYGLKIKFEEVRLQDLGSKMMSIKMGDYGRKSWYAFNLNVGLPHMGRTRSRKDVLEFLRLSKDFLHHTSRGIITYADGDALHNKSINPTLSYTSFLDSNFAHYQALLESMEFDFPNHLGEARTALESLFVAPIVSRVELGRKWEDTRQCGELEYGLGLEGLELSGANLGEAKELVKEGVSLYRVRIDGEMKNEMVMEWNGVQMVRVCCWKR
ncbi:hypothetical protein ACS0TY_015434 [Phlomoides rotata]